MKYCSGVGVGVPIGSNLPFPPGTVVTVGLGWEVVGVGVIIVGCKTIGVGVVPCGVLGFKAINNFIVVDFPAGIENDP